MSDEWVLGYMEEGGGAEPSGRQGPNRPGSRLHRGLHLPPSLTPEGQGQGLLGRDRALPAGLEPGCQRLALATGRQ